MGSKELRVQVSMLAAMHRHCLRAALAHLMSGGSYHMDTIHAHCDQFAAQLHAVLLDAPAVLPEVFQAAESCGFPAEAAAQLIRQFMNAYIRYWTERTAFLYAAPFAFAPLMSSDPEQRKQAAFWAVLHERDMVT
jgi:hypothetical protein